MGHSWWRLKRQLGRPLPWLICLIIGLITWWSSGAGEQLQSESVQVRLREIFPPEFTKDLRFFPANNQKIHYVGRWSFAPNRQRVDGSFPGVYFDLNVTNTSTVILSLSNSKHVPAAVDLTDMHEESLVEAVKNRQLPIPDGQHAQYAFSAASRLRASAPPVSLLALVDNEEYIVLSNVTSLVPIRMHDLDQRISHSIRVIAPMTDNGGKGLVQFDGLWLDKGGYLQPVEGSVAETHNDDGDDFDPEGKEIGRLHRLGLSNLLHRFDRDQMNRGDIVEEDDMDDQLSDPKRRKKLIEIITDVPAHLENKKGVQRARSSDLLLSGVMGWEYMLGEMFSVDHVCIGSEGMCLTPNCIGGTGSPSSMGDTFFRSGPPGSSHFQHPWPFQSYVPDVIIFNLGASDYYSFEYHLEDYNRTIFDLWKSFEDTYVSLVRAVRNLAYPNHPTLLEAERLGLDPDFDLNAPATIPIFIMRPLNGELEHATQNAVDRLRGEGDKGVFWLDTTGWLDIEDDSTTGADFFEDPTHPDGHLHLTEKGNQKVAIYLHMHVCRYLAAVEENCAFLPPEVYQGNVYDPSVATFDRYIESEKERQMKEIYYDPSDL